MGILNLRMTDTIEKLAGQLAGITLLRDAGDLTRLSRDFYWFSPVLKALLDDKRADMVAVPTTQDEVARIVGACATAGVPLTRR